MNKRAWSATTGSPWAGWWRLCGRSPGYRLNVVIGEAFGRQQASFMQAAGLRMLDVFQDPRRLDGPPDRIPYLFMTRKEWNEPAALGQISMLFHAPAARLGLSRAEQRAVLGALLGQTDREIAAAGGVSVDAVKQAWRRIHERMASTMPYLEDATRKPFPADHRSSEKRRHLVEYLRYHPEELRPVERLAQDSVPQHLVKSQACRTLHDPARGSRPIR